MTPLFRKHPLWKKIIPIKLWACEAGKRNNSIARQLKDRMKDDVPYIEAPNQYGVWKLNGDFEIHDSIFNFIYIPIPFSEDGKWVKF